MRDVTDKCACPSCAKIMQHRDRQHAPFVSRITAGLTLRKIAALLRYCLVRLRFGDMLQAGVFFVDRGHDLQIMRGAKVRLGNRLWFSRDFTGHFYGRVTIGDGVFFNRCCYVVVHNSLTIGNNCSFGEGVSIHDENHIIGYGLEPIAMRGFTTAPITIGDNVWVGAKATILPGVRIGEDAVIGANAVVTRDVPARVVAVGVPARVVHEVPNLRKGK